MRTKLLAILSAMAAVFAISACNSGMDDDDNNVKVYQDMVTLVSNGEDGCTMTMQQTNDTPVLTYTSSQQFESKNVSVGDRVMIAYRLATDRQPYTSGPVVLLAYNLVLNGKLSWGSAIDNDSWKTAPLQTQAIWLTGNYLNFHLSGQVRNEGKKFALVADETTKNEKMPTVYLIFISDDEASGTWKNFYASIDVSTIMANYDYDGFVLKMNNVTGSGIDKDTFIFRRGEQIKPAE